MASFSNQVIYKTGDSTSYATQMPQWLNDGVRDVVDRVLTLNPRYADQFVIVEATIRVSGNTIASPHLINIYRNTSTGIPVLAPMVGSGLIAQASVSDSIYYATESHPVSYMNSGKVYMYPIPYYGGSIWYAGYGTVDDSGGTITSFPSSLYELVVLYAAMRATEYRIAALRGEMRSYIDTDEDSELTQLKGGEIAKAESLLSRLGSEYASGFDRVRGAV